MHTISRHMAVQICLLFAAAVVINGCSRPVDLRFHPLPTEARAVRVTMDQKVSVSVMGQNNDMSTSNTTAYTFKVDSVDPNGVASVTVTVDEMDLGASGGFSEMLSGMTGAAAGDSLTAEKLGLKGKSFTMKVAPDGQVDQVAGMSSVVDEVSKKLVEETKKQLANMKLPAEAQAMQGMMSQMQGMITEMVETQIRRTIGDAAMQESMGDLLTMYTTTPVRVGDTWTRGVVRSQGMYPSISSETWKLVENKDGIAKLEFQSQIAPNNNAPAMTFAGMSIQMLLSGQSSGTVELETANGWLTKSSSTHQIDVQMKLPVQVPGMGDMTTKVSGTVTIECTPK